MAQTLNVFDSITFFKGTNIIKNFYNYLGPELFFKGLRNLLKKNTGGTVNYEKFKEVYSSLSTERDSKLNPVEFLDPFIVKNGINELSCNYTVEGDKITMCSVTQSSSKLNQLNQVLYQFNTNISVINRDFSEKNFFSVSIPSQETSEIKELVGLKKPAIILLNHGDSSYFRQIFNAQEVDFFCANGHVRVIRLLYIYIYIYVYLIICYVFIENQIRYKQNCCF